MIKHYQVIYHISTTNHYDAEWWTAIGILTGYYPTIVNHYSLLLSHCILGFAIQEPPKITAIPHKKYSPRFPSGKQWARFQALACMHHYISCIHIYIYVSACITMTWLSKFGNESSLQHHSSTGIVNTNPAESNEIPAGAYREKVFQVPSSAHVEDFITTYPPVN